MAARVALRERATRDATDALGYYENEATLQTARDFVDALEQAFDHLAKQPLTGSLQYAFELDIPELRTWPVRRFPYLIFYVTDEETVDVWRIMHARRDIPASFTSQPSEHD